jgi:hypothetical protein
MSDPSAFALEQATGLLLAACEEDPYRPLTDALIFAVDSALEQVDVNLQVTDSEELHERRRELCALLKQIAGHSEPDDCPAGVAVWRLVLSYLPASAQQLAQEALEAIHRAAALDDSGEEEDARLAADAQRVLVAVEPLERLLAELPHTTLTVGLGRDDHVQRRRTLHVEVCCELEPVGASPIRVEWRDGYETLIAVMSLAWAAAQAYWLLDIQDPPPGRELQQELAAGGQAAARLSELSLASKQDRAALRAALRLLAEVAERELESAIEWATGLLGEDYVLARS